MYLCWHVFLQFGHAASVPSDKRSVTQRLSSSDWKLLSCNPSGSSGTPQAFNSFCRRVFWKPVCSNCTIAHKRPCLTLAKANRLRRWSISRCLCLAISLASLFSSRFWLAINLAFCLYSALSLALSTPPKSCLRSLSRSQSWMAVSKSWTIGMNLRLK